MSHHKDDEAIIVEDNDDNDKSQSTRGEFSISSSSSSSVWEIEEECCQDGNSRIPKSIANVNYGAGMGSLASIRELELDGCPLAGDDDDDVVYVGVGKSNSSMDALSWSLANIININSSETIIFLIHVFPELRFIPTPLGKLPISQVNPQQKESYLIQERVKRRDFLQKFLDVCSSSKVKVDTILIESDLEAKALLDLIPILNIRKLVLGTSKSSLRKLRSRKGNGIVDQVLQHAPEFCEVKIVCEGVLVDTEAEPPSPSPSASPRATVVTPTRTPHEDQNANSFGCTCFKSKVIR